MKDIRETWIEGQERVRLKCHTRNIVVVPLPEGKIRFLRGHSFFDADPRELEPRKTKVISAIDKRVVLYHQRHDTRPESANLLTLDVEADAVSEPKMILETESGHIELPLIESGAAWLRAEKQLLFTYGPGAVDRDVFENVLVVDIAKSDDAGFQQKVKFIAGEHERELGIIDFLIKNPADEKLHTSRYGLFKTRTPTFKLVCPCMAPNEIEVILDDGDDDTKDTLDITRIVDHANQVSDYADFPVAVKETSKRVRGTWDNQTERSRIYEIDPPDEGNMALFLYGENRIVIKDKSSQEILFIAHFVLYTQDDETVVGFFKGTEDVTVEGHTHTILSNHILIAFKEDTLDDTTGSYLYSLNLRPQGLSRAFNIVQVAPHGTLPGQALNDIVIKTQDYSDTEIEEVLLDLKFSENIGTDTLLETYPYALRNAFNAPNGEFNHAQLCYFHHFYMHTFPAHRLIDKIRFPDADPVSLHLRGTNFDTDKTFVLPSGKDEIRHLSEQKKQHTDRKIAIFGHTDRVGTVAHNNRLSKLRGESVFALLSRNYDWWKSRFTIRGGEEKRWGTREVQNMLQALNYYRGRIDGYCGPNTKKALREFKDKEGISPKGAITTEARDRLVEVYIDDFLDAAMPADHFFQDNASDPAVFGCGEEHPIIQTDRQNPQNRRVTFILRRTPGEEPIDTTQVGANVPYSAWLSQETDAAAAADAALPDFSVGCWDTGFGEIADDYGGDNLDKPNRFMIKGKRLVRPTRICNGAAVRVEVFPNGKLNEVADGPSKHGSQVMSCMTGDGAGNEILNVLRNATQVVLGTGKDTLFRAVKHHKTGVAFVDRASNLLDQLCMYEVMEHDEEVKIVSSSLLYSDISSRPSLQRSLERRMRDMLDSGKVYFIAACNVVPPQHLMPPHPPPPPAGWQGQRDASRTEGGFFAPRRSQQRSSFAGDNAFKRNLVVVGATDHVANADVPELPTNFSYLGEEVSLAAPGHEIRTIRAGLPSNTSGTSFATPITAGIAAEMMLVDEDLKLPANLIQLVEMLEATADPLPSLSSVPQGFANRQRGFYVHGANWHDTNLNNDDLAGFRRVNFWKAILAAINAGIPTESQWDTVNNTIFVPGRSIAANAVAATTHFDSLTAKNHAATTWYGFEIRVQAPRAQIWLKKSDNSFVRLEDSGAAMPGDRTFGATWRKTQALRTPAAHANAGFRHYVLPAFPFAAATWWMCQFSIKREELGGYSELRIYHDTVDPAVDSASPALCVLDLAHVVRMRNPGAITDPEKNATPALDQIKTHVEEFDDFVFHITINPQPLTGFKLVHPEGLNIDESKDVAVYAVDRFGNVKTDFNADVTVRQQKTGGAASTAVLVGNAAGAAGAQVVKTLVNGKESITFTDANTEDVRLTATDGAQSGNSEIKVARPGPLSKLRVEVRHWNGDDPLATPPLVAQRLKVTVTALDAQDRTKTNFNKKVKLSVVENEMGFDAPGNNPPYKGGVHVADTVNDRFRAAKFEHTYNKVNDKGKHVFSVFVYTSGPLVLRAQTGTVSVHSRRIHIKAGALETFKLDHPTDATAGNTFEIAATAKDRYGNTIDIYTDKVNLTRLAGTPGAEAGGVKSGLHFNSAEGAGGDHYAFVQTDKGVHRFPLTACTPENVQVRVAADADNTKRADTGNIAVAGPGALNRFEFEVDISPMKSSRYPVTVKALDANGKVKTDLTGNVNLTLPAGTVYAAGGGNPRGTQITGSPHNYAAADQGQFVFQAVSHTPEQIQFRASHAGSGVSTDSPQIQINSWQVQELEINVGANQNRRTPFNVTVTAKDTQGNIKRDFTGTVSLTLTQGTPYGTVRHLIFWTRPAGVQIIGSPHNYVAGDNGSHNFSVTAYTRETIRFEASHPTTSGAITETSVNVTVN